MFLVQDYNPIDRSFGPALALPKPKEYGVPDGYDLPIMQLFWERDHEAVKVSDNVVVFRRKEQRRRWN